MMENSYAISQDYIASEGQTIFKIAEPFIKNGINVFVNGVLMVAGEAHSYIALPDIGKIVFNVGLHENDVVSVRGNSNEGVNLTIISAGRRDKANALFQKYSSAIKLNYNNRYNVQVSLQGKLLNYSFVTKFNPFFCTTKKILEDIGQFIIGFSEEYISSIIHRNSIELIDKLDQLKKSEEAIENVTVEKDDEGFYVSTYKAVGNWVRAKTEIDLIYAKYYGMSAKCGSEEKSIGDISISKTVNLPELDNLLKKLKRDQDAAEEVIAGRFAFTKSVVKAGSTYKYTERGSF